MPKAGSTKWWWSAPAVFLTAVLMSAYAWWTLTQYGRLNDLNQRELAAAADVLEDTVENAIGTVRRRFEPLPGECRPGPGGTGITVDDICRSFIREFTEGQPYLEYIERCESTIAGQTLGQVVPRGQGFVVVGPEPICFRFLTNVLLQELPFPESFSLIVLADPMGGVLYQDAPAGRRWLHLLRWSEREFRDSVAAQSGGARVGNLATLVGATSWDQISSATGRSPVQLSGAWHQFYLQPVVLDDGTSVGLVVGGLVPTAELVRQALAVDTYFVALLVGVLLLAALGLPFIKLATLHPRERFRPSDVHWLYVSTGALLGFLTFVVLVADGYTRWRNVANAGLEELADHLSGQFLDEVTAVRDQLVRYDNQLVGDERGTSAPGGGLDLGPVHCGVTPYPDWFNRPPPAFPVPTQNAGLLLEQAAWVDPQGAQIWKITVSPFSRNVSVVERPYFRAVRDGHLYQIAGEGPEFFLSPDRSITDGRFYTFLAIKSRLGDTARAVKCPAASPPAPQGIYVAVATVKLLSLHEAALPAGYGFAVVNREGRVLYHSDSRLSLRQDLFAELSRGDEARSVMFGGIRHAMSSRYRERASRLFLAPLALTRADDETPAGLYLTVFRDLSMEWAVVARAFITSLAGPLILLTGFLGAGLFALSRGARQKTADPRGWLWPHGGMHRCYRNLTLMFAGLLGLALGLTAFGLSEWLLLLPPLAAAAGVAMFVPGYRAAGPRTRLSGPGWHVAVFCLLCLCMTVVPAAAMFRLTLGHELGALIQTERRWIDEQQRDIQHALQAAAFADGYSATVGDQIAAARLDRFVSPPAPFSTAPTAVGNGASYLLEAHESLDRRLPLASDVTARYRYQPTHSVYYPPGSAPFGLSWLAVVGLLAILGVLVAWIRWNANRVFLADIESPTVDPVPAERFDATWDALSADERYLLMQVARDRMANPYQRQAVEGLLNAGLVSFGPELRPSSPDIERLVQARVSALSTSDDGLQSWEQALKGHSWRHARTVVLVSMAVLLVFLVATQPAVQSDLVGIGSGALALAALAVRLRQTVLAWFEARSGSGSA